MTLSPNGCWLLFDTYPDTDNTEGLKLFNLGTGELHTLGRFYSDPAFRGDIRCDLHPRWNRSGRAVCFDSIHEGSRQLYVIDLELP